MLAASCSGGRCVMSPSLAGSCGPGCNRWPTAPPPEPPRPLFSRPFAPTSHERREFLELDRRRLRVILAPFRQWLFIIPYLPRRPGPVEEQDIRRDAGVTARNTPFGSRTIVCRLNSFRSFLLDPRAHPVANSVRSAPRPPPRITLARPSRLRVRGRPARVPVRSVPGIETMPELAGETPALPCGIPPQTSRIINCKNSKRRLPRLFVLGKIPLNPLLLLPAERRIRQDHIHTGHAPRCRSI